MEKEYTIKELKDSWKVGRSSDGIEITYNISKELCATIKDVENYIKEHINNKEG